MRACAMSASARTTSAGHEGSLAVRVGAGPLDAARVARDQVVVDSGREDGVHDPVGAGRSRGDALAQRSVPAAELVRAELADGRVAEGRVDVTLECLAVVVAGGGGEGATLEPLLGVAPEQNTSTARVVGDATALGSFGLGLERLG